MNANIAISYTDVPGFPAGSVVDHIIVTVVGTANTLPNMQAVPPGTASVSFDLAADDYTVSAQGFPATGPGFGLAVSTTFTITAAATISLSLPASLAATQS